MRPKRKAKEPSRGADVASWGDVHVDDLAVLVDRSVHVPPPACDLYVCLVHEPAVADCVTAWPGRVGEEWREALHPPIHGHVVDLDPTFGEQFFDVAVRQAVPEVPAHCENDDLGREAETGKRRTRYCAGRARMRSEHATTLTGHGDYAPMQQSRREACR
jgi:hypothetical protein